MTVRILDNAAGGFAAAHTLDPVMVWSLIPQQPIANPLAVPGRLPPT
ncbi:hypothetical protein [Arthrobacter sp. 135MFCol5.1]|nr:hypothetical protein [Arthrobacter sp. 135MFCol5.1]